MSAHVFLRPSTSDRYAYGMTVPNESGMRTGIINDALAGSHPAGVSPVNRSSRDACIV